MKKLLSILLIFVALFLIGCNEHIENDKDENFIYNLEIDGDASVEIGKEIILEPSYDYDDINVQFDFSWSVDDESIAIIEDGVLKGLKEGTVIVTLKDNISNLETDVAIKVNAKPIPKTTTLKIEASNKNLTIGDELVLTAKYDENTQVDLEWSVNNNLATINNGKLVAVDEGQVTVTLKDKVSNLEDSVIINIAAPIIPIVYTVDDMLDWAFEQIGTEALDEVNFPYERDGFDVTYEWISEDDDVVDVESGYVGLFKIDEETNLTCIATYNGETKERTIKFTALGYAAYDVRDAFLKQFKANQIFNSMPDLETKFDLYGGSTITWESKDQSIFSNKGVLTKGFYEQEVVLTLHVKLTNPDYEKDIDVTLLAQPMDINEKIELVKKWIENNVSPDGKIYKTTVLPTFIDDYGISLEWRNQNGQELNLSFSADNPILGDALGVLIKMSCIDGTKASFEMSFQTAATKITDMWEKIDLFVNTIAGSDVTAFSYYLITWSGYSNGYVPFFTNNRLEVIEDILPYTDGNVRTGIKKAAYGGTQYIVVHDTGNSGNGADAKMHNSYIKNLNNNNGGDRGSVSWHFTVDDKECYQHLPLDEVSWNAGDGGHVYGETYHNSTYNADCIGGGNYNGISIESCVHYGTDYTYTMRRLAKLVAGLLIDNKLTVDRVKQHNHFSGKNCPMVIRENNRWNEFIYLVKLEYYGLKELEGVTFEWTSLTPELMDNEGRLLGKYDFGTTVSYKVKVTYNGVSKEYTFSSILKSR